MDLHVLVSFFIFRSHGCAQPPHRVLLSMHKYLGIEIIQLATRLNSEGDVEWKSTHDVLSFHSLDEFRVLCVVHMRAE